MISTFIKLITGGKPKKRKQKQKRAAIGNKKLQNEAKRVLKAYKKNQKSKT